MPPCPQRQLRKLKFLPTNLQTDVQLRLRIVPMLRKCWWQPHHPVRVPDGVHNATAAAAGTPGTLHVCISQWAVFRGQCRQLHASGRLQRKVHRAAADATSATLRMFPVDAQCATLHGEQCWDLLASVSGMGFYTII